jgi:hypothetical protein
MYGRGSDAEDEEELAVAAEEEEEVAVAAEEEEEEEEEARTFIAYTYWERQGEGRASASEINKIKREKAPVIYANDATRYNPRPRAFLLFARCRDPREARH